MIMLLKNWPSWVKGSLIGLIIGVIGFTLGIFNFIVNLWCNNFVFPKCLGDNCGCDITAPILIFTILIMIIGALIGLLIGKSKNN